MAEETKTGNTYNIIPPCFDEPIKAVLTPSARQIGSFFGDLIMMATSKIHFSAEKMRLQQAHDLEMFKNDLNKKLNEKPSEQLVEPRMQVAGQAIENAKFCLGEPQIREMFLNLLANSADERYQGQVHPSFSAMIAQMSPLDAENLSLFQNREQFPIVEYRFNLFDDTYQIVNTNYFVANRNMRSDEDRVLLQAPSLSSLERQKLLEISYTISIPNDELYREFEETDLMKNMQKRVSSKPQDNFQHPRDDKKIVEAEAVRGIVKLTPLGKAFIKVCFKS